MTFQTLYPNGKSSSSERNAILGKQTSSPSTTSSRVSDNDADKTHETGEESSSSEEEPQYLTTGRPPTQHIFFTAPPPPLTTTTTNGFGFRRKQTTRLPTERTSFTTSTESLDSDQVKDSNTQNDEKNDGNGASSFSTIRREFVTTPYSSTPASSTDRDDITYKAEESQLNKMLLEEIPPHREKGAAKKSQEEDNESKSTEFNLTLTPTSADPLARIIKNLAPRWGRNRTVETTTMTSGNYKYDFTISSREKSSATNKGRFSKEKINSSQEKDNSSSSKEIQSSETRSTSTLSSVSFTTNRNLNKTSSERRNPALGGYGLNTIQSPDLSRRKDHDEDKQISPPAGEFLDILVGSEDHKSLVTKETEDGIVTSAILPPWYDTATTGNNTLSSNGTHPAGEETEHESSESEESASSERQQQHNKDVQESASSSVLGGLFDFFNTLPTMNRNRNREDEVRKPLPPISRPQPPIPFQPQQNPKRGIILKRPGGELLSPPGFNPLPTPPPHSQEVPKNETETSIEQEDNGVESAKIHTILPSNIMTTTIIPEAVVTQEDIRPANNAFHYGSPDGGTNIYGYYPDDDDKDNDKTVETLGIQSETISDPNELMGMGPEKTPAHSIELQINSDASSEVVIEQDGDHNQGQGQEAEENEDYNPYATRYGETHTASGSEIRKQVVEAPQSPPTLPKRLGGDGIRKPIKRGGSVGITTVTESSTDFLEMKGTENRPVLANTRIIPHQLIRQRRPTPTTTSSVNAGNNVTNKRLGTRTTTSTTSAPKIYIPNSSSISGEVLDNSAEQDPLPQDVHDFKRKNYNLGEKSGENGNQDEHDDHQQQPQFSVGSGSFEVEGGGGESTFDASGSGEQPGKWSRPDPNQSLPTSLEEQEKHDMISVHENYQNHQHPVSNEVGNISPPSGDESGVVERKPIQTLDETLYPDHSASGGSGSIEIENKKVFQVFPVGYSPSTSTSTTERPLSESTISEPDKSSGDDQVRFVPPAPVNFHENMYTFSPPNSDSIYQSKDGWRPLVYNDGEEDDSPTAPGPQQSQPPPQQIQSQPPRPALHWRDRLLQQGILRQPVVTTAPMLFDLSTAASQNSLNNQHLASEVDNNEHDHGEQEQEVHHNGEVPSQENQQPDSSQGGHVSWGDDTGNKPHSSENSPKVLFPTEENHEEESHDQYQVQQLVPPPHFHNHNNQPQTQRIPMQIPTQQQVHHQFQPQHLHQRPQTQYQFQNGIDRSKYMMRPAPPPILMRRTPINNMGYRHPHNNNLPPRPQLIPQVAQQQVQHQFNNNNQPPPEFHRPQQNLVNRRRFKTLGARPRGVNWTETGSNQGEAERRNG